MRVLIATDGSKHAEEAAQFLAHLPHTEKMAIEVLAVTPQLEIHGSREIVEWAKRNESAEAVRIEEICQRIERVFEGANVEVTHRVIKGHPRKTIVEEADKRRVDLIVLGALGHSLSDRFMLGSVSDFVATHAHCSVLVVRPTGISQRREKQINVCLAYDDSEPCRKAIDELTKFKWQSQTKMDVLHALTVPLYGVYGADVPIEIDVSEIRQAMTKIVDGVASKLRAICPNISSHVIDTPHVGNGIVQWVEEHDVDLLVVGDTGRGLIGRFFLGSIARFVLRHSPSSVWIARHPS